MKRTVLPGILMLGQVAVASLEAAPRDIRIGVIGKSSANIVFLPARRGAEDAAQALSKKHGVRIEAVWLTPSREDATVQAATIRKAVAEGMGAILVACSDAVPLTPAINEAVAKGVPVMTFDSDAPASKRFAFYGADDADVGDKVMTDLARLLSEKGKVAVLAGNASAPNLRARVEAVRKAAARYPEIEIVDVVNHEETPQDAATAVLTADAAHPDLDGWAMVGGWALFRSSQSLAFAEDLHKRGLRVVAVDALPEELSYIERGLVPVLWGQPIYLWGQVGVETIVDHVFFGKTVPERIRMELVRVTRESLGSWARKLKSWGFTSIPEEYLRRQ